MWILSFWVLPIISACMWISMLITMISVWSIDGQPHYASMSAGQTVAYISDIGAGYLKPLFITGSAITVVFLDLSLLSMRWLRHKGLLPHNKGVFDKFCAVVPIFFSIVGAAALILLSIFNTLHYHRLHYALLIVFIGGYLLSAIFICFEYWQLGVFYHQTHVILFINFWIKLFFFVVELALSIAFGLCSQNKTRENDAAALEWTIAFVFTFYILSFIVDLLPAVRTRQPMPNDEKEAPAAASEAAGSIHRPSMSQIPE